MTDAESDESESQESADCEHGEADVDTVRDVVVVGGGPAGCAAGVFLARYGLDVVLFDRGAGSLDRCAFVANYPGFPGGIDVGTLTDLLQAHAREADCGVVSDLVESVTRADEDEQFTVETQDGRRILSDQVLAATRYDGEYLRPLGGDEMFEMHDHGDEERETFDRDYPDAEGRTPVDGLYVASPTGERDAQAIVAAGQGAHVARRLIEDRRSERGYPEELARHYDWLRPDSEFEGEWAERDRWREWFDARLPEGHDVEGDELDRLREAYVDRAFETRRSDDEISRLTRRAHRELAAHLDPDAVLDAVGDERIRERAAQLDAESPQEGTE